MLDAVNPVNNLVWCHLWCNYSYPFLFSPLALESKHWAHSCLWEEAWHVICGPEKGKGEDILKFNPSPCRVWFVIAGWCWVSLCHPPRSRLLKLYNSFDSGPQREQASNIKAYCKKIQDNHREHWLNFWVGDKLISVYCGLCQGVYSLS